MAKASWLLVVDSCGTVIAVAGGVPERWAGASADDLARAAPHVAALADEAAAAVRSGAPRGLRRASLEQADVEVVALPVIALDRAPCQLRTIVERALAPFAREAEGRNVLLCVEDEPDEQVVLDVDVIKITWVITTLVGNSLRFVRSGSRHLPGGTVRVRIRRPVGQAVIEVEDDGAGIPAHQITRLFDPAAMGGGTAIALAMARDVIRAHGGSLVVESSTDDERHGTVVRITLPHTSA